ncbi:hypothetical protein L9F63_022170, partial [Diploptera punctata]
RLSIVGKIIFRKITGNYFGTFLSNPSCHENLRGNGGRKHPLIFNQSNGRREEEIDYKK